MKYIIRVSCLPGFMLMQAAFLSVSFAARCFRWIRYGGEAFDYDPTDRATIYKIYRELKDKQSL